MSYTIDVYRGKVEVEKSFLNFLTYISMFPQLVAGPIVRYEDVAKELKSRKIDFNSFSEGLFIFLTGLFEKVLIANNVGHLHSLIVSDISNISLLTAWLGIIAYALQIYFDFNGYSTMAIGMGKMMGFYFPKNFNYPYISTSITEFWRRWHITLSTWFRDYVYIPLGGNRVKKYRWLMNIMIVWTLTGIWHGASWNFAIWGIYFGIILIIEKLFIGQFIEKLPKVFRHIYALFLILLGWLIFFCDDLTLIQKYIPKIFANPNIIDNEFIFYIKNYMIFLISGIVFSIPIVNKIIPFFFLFTATNPPWLRLILPQLFTKCNYFFLVIFTYIVSISSKYLIACQYLRDLFLSLSVTSSNLVKSLLCSKSFIFTFVANLFVLTLLIYIR